MKKISLLLGVVGSLALVTSGVSAQEVLSQNVVGYYNISIEPGLNLVAFPFQKIPATRGVISANAGAVVTDQNAVWGDNFGYVEEGESTFYVEITSGAFEGRHMYIASHTGSTLTIDDMPADIGDGELAGAGYKIVAANRIRDLFGEPGSPLLAGGSGAGDSDAILMWTGSGWADAIYYKSAGFPIGNRNNWNRGSSLVNDLVVDRDAAVFVRRRADSDALLTIVGEVSPNTQQVVLSSGLNLLGGLSVINEPIGDSTLTATLAGGSGAGDSDTILAWLGNGWDTAIFYKTAGFPIGNRNHWNQGSTIVDDTFAISPIKGYFMRVRGDAPLGPWSRLSPLAAE